MTNYVQSTNFATKDNLASGNALKIVKGTEINTEYANIAIAVATKADLASPTFTGTPTLPTGTIATTQSLGNSTTAVATTAFVQAAMALLHPVGSIYTAIIATNPGTLFGFGTWTAFGAGRMLISLDSTNVLFDTAEETGGSADASLPSHTHTASITSVTAGTPAGSVLSTFTGAAMAAHSHTFSGAVGGGGGGGGQSLNTFYGQNTTDTASAGTPTGTVTSTFTGSALATHTHTVTNSTEGVSGTNANYPPFIAVYMWKRTA